jgi:hypothetical protein
MFAIFFSFVWFQFVRTQFIPCLAPIYVIIQFTYMLYVKGYGVAMLAQNKIFPAKQELLLSEITGLPLDAQMQRNRLDVDERVEGSRQCSCSRPS